MHKGRLEAFSDGVLAIIITIMVLEMKPPLHGAALADLKPVLPAFLSYILSFVYLGIYWNNHHHMFQVTHRVSGGILWANLHLLFWLSLVPFTTAWMGENHAAPAPTAAYGFVLLMAAIAYYILQRAIITREGSDSLLASALGRGNVAGTSASCRSRSSGMAVLQLGSQCGARTAQPGHDRPDGDLENRRDLFDAGVQPVVEDDDGSLPLGQVTHGPDERVEQLRVVLERSNDAQLGHPRVGTLLPLLAPQLIDREVDRDPLQPGSKRARRVEAVERAERTENRILRDVVGEHPVTRDAVGPVPDEWPEAREELVDRRFLARAREGDQLRLVHVSTIRPWGGANFPNAAARKGQTRRSDPCLTLV